MKMQEQHRMYQNPILEALSFSSPKLMIPFHCLLISIALYIGITSNYLSVAYFGIFIFLGGAFFWTFAEYCLHRWVFHYVSESKVMKNVHYAVHGYHHSNPRDADRLFMPPVPAFIILSFFFGLFYLVMGKAAWFFLPGFELGYLAYAMIHYFIHTEKPPKRWRDLWRHHSLHHHQYPDLAFGVSNMFWDKVFGTMPPPRKIRNSEN